MNKRNTINIIWTTIYCILGLILWPKTRINIFQNQPLTFELGVTCTILVLGCYYFAWQHMKEISSEKIKLHWDEYK